MDSPLGASRGEGNDGGELLRAQEIRGRGEGVESRIIPLGLLLKETFSEVNRM